MHARSASHRNTRRGDARRRPESTRRTRLTGLLRAASLGAVGADLALVMRDEPGRMARGWQPIARPVLTGLIVGLEFATLASQPFEWSRWFGDSRATTQNWLALWPVLSAVAALGSIAAIFALRSRALTGAGPLGARWCARGERAWTRPGLEA